MGSEMCIRDSYCGTVDYTKAYYNTFVADLAKAKTANQVGDDGHSGLIASFTKMDRMNQTKPNQTKPNQTKLIPVTRQLAFVAFGLKPFQGTPGAFRLCGS